MKHRNVNVDFIKIVACVGVVALHTLRNVGPINTVLTLISMLCIPMFFLVNGFLLFRKQELTYKYIGKKILRILAVCFSWEALHGLIYYAYYREMRDFVSSFFLDFLQKGLFFHFWFMGALMIVYLAAPILFRTMKADYGRYKLILLCLLVISLLVDLMQLVLGDTFVLAIPQTLRVWLWILYFMLGGLLARNWELCERKYKERTVKQRFVVLVAGIGFLITWMILIGSLRFGRVVMNEAFYGSAAVIIATVCLFWFCANQKLSKTAEGMIAQLTPGVMGVYVMHPFVLAVIQKFIPEVLSNWWMNILFWIVTVVICEVGSWILDKIPVLRELIRL